MQRGGEVVVRTLRCPNDDEMRDLLKRIANVGAIADFYFCEVHKYNKDTPETMSVVIGNVNAPYPKEKERKEDVIYSPRTETTIRTTNIVGATVSCTTDLCNVPEVVPYAHPRIHTIKVA